MKKTYKPVIIGIVGEKLSGKDLVTQYLVKKGKFASFRFSYYLDSILEKLHIEVSRANEANLAGALRERFGGEVLAEAIKAEIIKNNFNRVIIDGVRYSAEVETLKTLPGFNLVYVTAPLNIRYERARLRGEKAGEQKFSFSEFQSEERLETELYIKRLGKKAKIKLVNDSSLDNLYKEIDKKIIKKYENRGKKS